MIAVQHVPMRIRENTPDRLIVEDQPWFLGGVLIVFVLGFVLAALTALTRGDVTATLAFVGVAAGVGLIFGFFVERVWLILDRRASKVELRRRSLRRFRTEGFALPELEYALVQTNYDSDGNTYRLVLKRRDQQAPVPVTSYYSGNQSDTQRMVDAIDTWLKASGRDA